MECKKKAERIERIERIQQTQQTQQTQRIQQTQQTQTTIYKAICDNPIMKNGEAMAGLGHVRNNGP